MVYLYTDNNKMDLNFSNRMKKNLKLNVIKPNALLEIENHIDILKFRCSNTNILIWPILRDNFFRLLLSKFFYGN